ncbi:MAG: glyoxalase, partial [Niameybacter sp.]
YIEVDDLDAFNTMIEKEKVELVHPLQTHDWGQRGLRMYDPDMHIIEVSEPLTQVVARLANQGLDVASIAKKTMLPTALVEEWLK